MTKNKDQGYYCMKLVQLGHDAERKRILNLIAERINELKILIGKPLDKLLDKKEIDLEQYNKDIEEGSAIIGNLEALENKIKGINKIKGRRLKMTKESRKICKNCGLPKSSHFGRSYNICTKFKEKKE